MKVVLITGHDYESPRKTGFYFWAEVLTGRGIHVDWITVGLSRLTFLKKDARSYAGPFNQWARIKANLDKFVWCPPFHPVDLGKPVLNALTAPVFALYPALLPKKVLDHVQGADVFIVECGAGPALVPILKKLNPQAKFIYNYSDRLNVVKFHPFIMKAEKDALPYYDLIRTNGGAMVDDFDQSLNVQYIPQAIDKSLFDNAVANPYGRTKNAISVGDMLFDAHAIETLAERFPDWTFHLFGKKSKPDKPMSNIIVHGEKPFADLVPYLIYADIGIAPYQSSPDADYLSQSSLKMVQYSYCRLPIVAPDFAAKGRDHVLAYDPDNIERTIGSAFERAITYERQSIDRSNILNWDELIDRMLAG